MGTNSRKTIYCPRCGRKTMTYDGRGTMVISSRCSKCQKIVIYKPTEDEVAIIPEPLWSSSAGKRFY